jgi:hypothetical protein
MRKTRASKGQRPRLAPVSEDVSRLSALLAQELLSWPDVRLRAMFGLQAFYRGSVVFAMLPAKRALETPNAIAYKLSGGEQKKEGEKWQLFDLENEGDTGAALVCLNRAYREADQSVRNSELTPREC